MTIALYIGWFFASLAIFLGVCLGFGFLISWLEMMYHRIMFSIERWRLRRELDKLDRDLWDAGEDWDESEG